MSHESSHVDLIAEKERERERASNFCKSPANLQRMSYRPPPQQALGHPPSGLRHPSGGMPPGMPPPGNLPTGMVPPPPFPGPPGFPPPPLPPPVAAGK